MLAREAAELANEPARPAAACLFKLRASTRGTLTSSPCSSSSSGSSSQQGMAHFSVQNVTPPILGDAGVPPWGKLELTLARGDVLIVRGASGCGKTTLLRSLASLLPLDASSSSGELRLRGQLSTELPQGIYRSRVAYVAQHPARLPGTPSDFFTQVLSFTANADVRDYALISSSSGEDANARKSNDEEEQLLRERHWSGPGWRLSDATVEFGGDATPPDSASSVASLLDGSSSSSSVPPFGLGFPVGVAPSGTTTPQQQPATSSATSAVEPSFALPTQPWTLASRHWALSETAWSREWAQLSGGEAARAALAIAVALQARRKGEGVLLLDEPTSALDDASTRALERTLLLSQPRLTLIMITHSDDQAKRIVELARQTKRWVGILRIGEQSS